jgi:hypothetical protein
VVILKPTHGRYRYSAINARPVYDWPGGKRLAFYVALNLEWFAFGEGLGAELAPGGPQPDVLNYAWRDYGNRVGVFRLAELFGELKLPVSLLVNSDMVENAPQALAAHPDAEIVGHGRSNSERQGTLSEDDERALIDEATSRGMPVHARAAGSDPGFRSRASRPISCRKPATVICSTGAMTTSRCG